MIPTSVQALHLTPGTRAIRGGAISSYNQERRETSK